MRSASLQWYYDNKDALREKRHKQHAANPQRYVESSKRWKAANPEKVKAAQRRYNAANPNRAREIHWRKAGIDVAAARKLVAAHDGRCGICRTDKPGGNKGWHLDHDHKTGKPRGLLCCGCNLRLGWLEIRESAIARYLSGSK